MKKIKIRYTFKEIGGGIAGALKALFLDGLIVLIYSLLILIANLAIRAYEWLVKAIRNFPCVAVGATFLIMAAISVFVYADMKAKLNTAYYQKDQMEMRLDSAVNKGVQTAKYQTY